MAVSVTQRAVFNPFLTEAGSLLPLPRAFPDYQLQDVFLLPFYSALRQESSGEACGGQDSQRGINPRRRC